MTHKLIWIKGSWSKSRHRIEPILDVISFGNSHYSGIFYSESVREIYEG
jgi:hypothetical protein